MAKNIKRILSFILAFSMVFSMLPTAFAFDNTNGELSFFDFEASEYEVKENAGEIKIKIVRHGDGNDAADVSFKVADFLSTYGEDYEVVDENGDVLEKVYGKKPDILTFDGEDDSVISSSDFIEEEITEEINEKPIIEETTPFASPTISEETDEATNNIVEESSSEETNNADDSTEQVEDSSEVILDTAEGNAENETESSDEVVEETEVTDEDSTEELIETNTTSNVEFEEPTSEAIETETQQPVNGEKKSKSRGSSILDAQAKYLNLPDAVSNDEKEAALDETLDDMYSYFLSAEGASGKVHFKKGEKEKYITIKVLDNDVANENRVFMIALMGTDSEDTTIAANSTTYVSIIDDEPIETAQIDLVEDELILTNEEPTAYITVRRSSGTQYFTTVYLSTVTQTAKTSAYESFEAKQIAFVPGETEKKVVITGYDFSEFSYFGLRLEGGDNINIDNHYADVYLASNNGVMLMSRNNDIALANSNVSLLADNVTLGSSSKTYDVELPGGWKVDKSGDGSAWNSNNTLYIKQYDDDCSTMYVSNQKQNFVGVKSISYSTYTTNPSRGFDTRYLAYTTFFETDSDQTVPGCLDSHSWNGNRNWKEDTLELKKTGNDAYIKFLARCNSGGYDNVESRLDWVRFNYAQYTFSPQTSAETFSRKVYDFVSGAPNVYETYFDGESTKLYNPGGITVKHNSDNVSAFYANGSSTVTISASNVAKNEKLGLYLKGVYFASDDLSSHNVYQNGKYTTKKVYYVAAESNNTVVFTPNDKFVKSLKDAGVISDVHSDSTIKIFPVFGQKTVTVNFENTDRNDKNAKTKGKYDKDNLNSYLINIIEASNNKNSPVKVKKLKYNNWLDYYQMTVPVGSVVRVQSIPASDRTPSGIYWWYPSGGSGTVYYENGKTKHSAVSSSGDLITETDYTKGDVVANKNICIRPATGTQTFYVGYSPLGKDYILNVEDPDNPGEKLVSTLENAVMDTSESQAGGQSADANGSMWLTSPFIGRQYTITAYAPEECYVSWANMSGDTNNDGTIGNAGDADLTSRTSRDKSANPTYIYGNKLNVTLDTDNTRYYYEFVPKTVLTTRTKVGTVKREVNSLYNLSKNVKSKTYTPVSGAWMNIAGFVAQTDTNGNYAVNLKGLPSWGTISTAITVGEREYFATANIEAATNIIIPALEVFTAKGTSANYDKGGNITDDYITVVDDKLTLSVSVSSDNALKPTNARFFVYSDEGTSVVDCSEKTGTYKTETVTQGDKFTATLTFNPKEDLKFGYKVYVQFADQNGVWYEPIDVGYTFLSELDLAEFVFPLIGSSTLEDIYTSGFVTDIIGDPLGDIGIGSLSAFDTVSNKYTPEAAKNTEYESQFTWQQTEYQFGWSDTFYEKTKKTGEQKHDEKLKEFLKNVYDGKEKSAKVPQQSKYKTKSKFSWSVTPEVGFNLTLSQRQDSKNYFEDMVFYVKVDLGVSSRNTIALPVGINIAVDVALNGDIVGVYHMYVDYADSFETEDAVEYAADSFGLFKKFNNSVRREGYIFLNPSVSVKLGIGVSVVFVKGTADFIFDMDFQFTEIGTNAYGDVKIDLGWSIELVGFSVYSKNLYSVTEKMFNTEGTDGHIDFDYANTAALMMLSSENLMETDGEFSTDTNINRDYLDTRSEWFGEYGGISLMSLDATQGTQETVLQTGTSDNPYMSITKINDSEMLMVYVDDVPERADANKRAVYYSIGNGDTWSEAQILDDDGTLDDYPNVQDLGNGQLIVSWSSANKVHDEDADVTDVLSSLEIKTAFFDKTSKTFGDITQLTKTTDEDYTADVLPRAAYDENTDRLILYYTKTEYISLDDVEDLYDENTAPSVTAYLFYENGAWSNDGSVYTDDELYGMTEPEIESYKENWYGQRFLDLRVDSQSYDMLRMVESDSICYNGLSIFAWIVDWDRDFTTTDDRDVFMQIYNFDEASFTHNIRVTSESGQYSSPKLARSEGATYLFFGSQNNDSDTGEIVYLNVTDVIKNDKFTLESNGSTEYYVLTYERPAVTVNDENGKPVEVPSETVTVTADVAVKSDNVSDYDVYVDENGQMYLFWTEVHNGARQIVASLFDGINNESGESDDNELTYWSESFVLTNAEENVYYSGLGASVIDGNIYIGGARGDYVNNENTALVMQKHTPSENVKVTGIELENEYPAAGSSVDVIVTITNEGLLQSSQPTTVSVDVNGTVVEQEYTAILPGGASDAMTVSVELPLETNSVVIKAYSTQYDEQELLVEYVSDVNIANAVITRNDDESEIVYLLTADLNNNGNADSEPIVLNAYIDDKVVGTCEITEIGAGISDKATITLDLDDSAYNITDGKGIAEVKLVAEENGEVIFEDVLTAEKEFSAEAIELLSALTTVTFENDGAYTIELGDQMIIQPTFAGVDKNSLKVDWQTSSNGNVAYIDYSNAIITEKTGTTTITGIVVPNNETVLFNSNGISETNDWRSIIPSDMVKTVSATVTVVEKAEEKPTTTKPSSSGGGVVTTYTVSFDTDGGSVIAPQKVKKNGNLTAFDAPEKEGYVFGGWFTDKEFTNKFDLSSKITSNVQLYARWISNEKVDVTGWVNPFNDVAETDWFYENVKYASENGLFNGVSPTTFSPNSELTRAMLVTVLYRADNQPEVTDASKFADVTEDAYYADAVAWAQANGIVNGVSETEFAPDAKITREQIATIIYRYAVYKGLEAVDMQENLTFTDGDEISEYAVGAMNWIVGQEIIKGYEDSTVRPLNNATRAEATAILQRFLVKIEAIQSNSN